MGCGKSLCDMRFRRSSRYLDGVNPHNHFLLQKTHKLAVEGQQIQVEGQQIKPPKDMSAREEQARYETRLDGAGDLLKEAKAILADSEAIGQHTAYNLQRQRGALVQVDNSVNATRGNAAEASSHLTSLKRKNQWKILSLYFIIAVLSAHIVYRIVRAFT